MGGYRIHIEESGSGQSVVFESGLGEDTTTWRDVQPQVAQFAKTLTYDRPGIGKSEPSPNPRTIRQMSLELHTLLHAAGVPPPYVLVGHSLGGLIVEVFVCAYPAEVAALVLVDPAEPRLDEVLQAHMSAADWTAREKALNGALPQMPPAVKAELQALQQSSKDALNRIPPPHIPFVLLTGTKKNPDFPGNPLEQDLKLQLHNELLAQIPDGKHVLVPNSRHYIQNDAPEVVIHEIREVVMRGVQPTR